MFFGIMATISEVELIVEHTNSGLAAARRRVGVGGRPPVTSRSRKVRTIGDLLSAGHSIREAATIAEVNESTVCGYQRLANPVG
jgi:DNA invertase Pin-like site-specific DNA recombinase